MINSTVIPYVFPKASPAQTLHAPLGTAKFQWGLEQCETWWSTDALRTGVAVGDKAGYASFNDAARALTPLTKGHKGAAAVVLRDGDRFFGRRMEAFTVSGYERDGSNVRWHTVNEIPENYDIMDVRRNVIDPRLAGIVDGRVVHRFVENPRDGSD